MTIVDTHSRYCPATDPRFSYRGEDVVQTLERVCGRIGYPKTIRVDNGSEFISRDLDLWAYAKDVTLDFSRPGKPTDNSFIEAFNSKFRSECLNAHWFMTLADARLALWDDLVAPEFGDGTLVRLSDIRVENAGYFVIFTDQPMSQGAEAFLDWLRAEIDCNERRA